MSISMTKAETKKWYKINERALPDFVKKAKYNAIFASGFSTGVDPLGPFISWPLHVCGHMRRNGTYKAIPKLECAIAINARADAREAAKEKK